jgi:hypothetical protein
MSRTDAMANLQMDQTRERVDVRRRNHFKHEIDEQRGEEGSTTIVDTRGQEIKSNMNP